MGGKSPHPSFFLAKLLVPITCAQSFVRLLLLPLRLLLFLDLDLPRHLLMEWVLDSYLALAFLKIVFLLLILGLPP
jgi:hypothetical protein